MSAHFEHEIIPYNSQNLFIFSRMPSGTISPSEIPDSPSQTMPQSPRQKHSSHNSREGAPNPRRLPFEDEVRTFGVENTPALISCATSLSNLSLDDEPKIANDLLIKEMRLMHHLSDEQDDEQLASTSADQNDANPNFALNEPENCDAGEALSDSDDSSNDDDTLLKDCISAGMRRKNIESGTLLFTFDHRKIKESVLIEFLKNLRNQIATCATRTK